MPIEMPRGLPFSVDTWTPNSGRKRHHFLTHAHRDHLQGMPAHSFYPIYATRITKILTLFYLPQVDEELFVEIAVGETVLVRDPEGDFSVTALDANHCPGPKSILWKVDSISQAVFHVTHNPDPLPFPLGAVMFLFEGAFGNLLHTGDCRLSPDCLQKLPLKYIANKGSETCLDYLFLDCTFGRSTIDMPRKESAIQQVINCIWKHPHAPVVYLACDLLGQEDILVEVSRTFGSKIYVDKSRCAECFQALLHVAPEILSEDASSRFQVFEGFPRLYEKANAKIAEARANIQPEPLFIRPSAQWYACDDRPDAGQKLSLSEAVKDESGVWHVCYSMHSSRQELEWSLQLLRPKWVISTTPPCRAMELSYVKDHCFKTQVNTDDPIWRLFGVKSAPKTVSLISEVAVSAIPSSIVEKTTATGRGCSQLQAKAKSLLWDMPPTIERPLTLFGRARLGSQDPSTSSDGKIVTSTISDVETSLASSIRGGVLEGELVHLQEATVSRQVASLQVDGVSDLEVGVSEDRELEVKRGAPSVGSSSGYNDGLRRLYRSMNVPVPRPLPSLVGLMEMSKRARIGL